jgi:hypothetical protein
MDLSTLRYLRAKKGRAQRFGKINSVNLSG